jgi:shikimate kinase
MSDRPGLTGRTIALVGLMGVGKSSIGRRLAKALGLPFRDADAEIEKAAGRSVTDIFDELGEREFRDGERKVIARLLEGRPHVLAAGGGAFVDPRTRALMKQKAVTVWLRADLDVLVERVSRRDTRPLLRERDPRTVLSGLLEARAPHYAEADIAVDTGKGPHEEAVRAIIAALRERLEPAH